MDVKLVAFSVILAILAIAMGSVGIDCVRKSNDKSKPKKLTFLGIMVALAIVVVAAAIYMSRKKVMSTVAKISAQAGAKAGATAGATAGANAGAVTGAVSGVTGVPVIPGTSAI